MSFLFCIYVTGILDILIWMTIVFFVSDDFIVSLLTALPPSKATLRNVFENTSNLDNLCFNLELPGDKWDVDSAVEYYAQDTDQMKMRKMIFNLDEIGDTALADSLVEFAEPPAGMATQYHK